jgi:hypothetical protein
MSVTFRSLAVLAAFASLALAVPGCSGDENDSKDHDEHGDHDHDLKPLCELPIACQDIARACHAKDDGTAENPAHECHEIGHGDGTEAACSEAHDHCLEVCAAAPDLGSDGPLESCGDAGADGG